MNPKVDIVVGGQYGSEGKGKVAHYFSKERDYDAYIRVGSENAGHTIIHEGETYKMQVIPCGWVDEGKDLIIGPGGLFSIKQLMIELGKTKIDPSRITIDENAGIITQDHVDQEKMVKLDDHIGSTVHGCGAALMHKISRKGFKTAWDYRDKLWELGVKIGRTIILYKNYETIFIEGTQGTFLSVDHGMYPYCTSRNVLASSILGDCGISPLWVRDVIMVVRSYPIRVAGNSGSCYGDEISWAKVSERAKLPEIVERTTVTGNVRRVFEFSIEEVEIAHQLNDPTITVLTFADYLTTKDLHNLVEDISTVTPLKFLSNGPEWDKMVEL